MNAGTVIAIAIASIVVLGAVVFLTAARRQDVRGAGALSRETRSKDRPTERALPDAPTGREVERAAVEARSAALVPAAAPPPAPFVAPDPEAVGVSRRQFFNRATVTLMSASLGAFAAACLAFLWRGAEGGFGSRVNAGRLNDVINNIRANDGFYYVAEGRAWVTEYPADSLSQARDAYPAAVVTGLEAGVISLYQKCPHLGCRVPECKSSQWFECQCHGSQYNRVGERKGGPAPRGMDLFAMQITPGGELIIDTGTIFNGMPIGTNTTGQEAEGPNCTDGGDS